MKARPFLAVLLALGLLALSLGGGGWWLVWQRSPLGLQHRPAQLPRAARFVPRQAPLSLYWLSDGREPVAYARAVAPARLRRQAAGGVEQLRDGAFAAAGLDYPQELAAWLAPEIGLALWDPEPSVDPSAGPANWLLALHSRDAEGARRFVQRFWQTRSLAGADLQVTTYRGMGLISGRGALAGSQPVPLATALVDDDLLLVASGRGVLEQALDVSQIDELNQAGDAELRSGLERLGPAAALLVAQEDGLENALAWPGGGQLLAALRPEGAALRLEALLRPAARDGSAVAPQGRLGATAEPPGDPALRQSLLAAAPAASDRLALLQDPAALWRSPRLRPLLARAAGLGPGAELRSGQVVGGGPLPPLLLTTAAGPLMAADGPAGWLMATPRQQPPLEALEAPLAAAGLIPAPLELAEGPLTVWTRLQAGDRRKGRSDRGATDRLQAPLEGWRAERGALALWGRSLALVEGEGPARGARRRTRQLEAVDLPGASLAWALAEAPARELLRSWQPWLRLSALAGGALEQPVRGLALALEGGEGELRLRAKLEFPASG